MKSKAEIGTDMLKGMQNAAGMALAAMLHQWPETDNLREHCTEDFVQQIDESTPVMKVQFHPLLIWPPYMQSIARIKDMPTAERVFLEDAAIANAFTTLSFMEQVSFLKNVSLQFGDRDGRASVRADVKFPAAVDLMISEETREFLAAKFVVAVAQIWLSETYVPFKIGEMQKDFERLQKKFSESFAPKTMH